MKNTKSKSKTKIKTIKNNNSNINKPIIESYENLIKKDYLDFIKKQEDYDVWTKCQTKIFKKKYNKKEYLYPDSSSNKQLCTFFKQIFKDKKKHYFLNRLYILLTNFISNKYASFIINELYKNPNMSDREFIKLINNTNEINKKPGIYGDLNTILDNDSCPEKEYEFQNINKHFKDIFEKNYNLPCDKSSFKKLNYRYLDIGCGSGKKTKLVANIFDFPKSLTYGTDIKNWGPYSSSKKFNFDFKYILDNGKLDFPDNYFGFVTCFFTLHHIPYLSQMIQEIKRVLIPNGLILIIEHDVLDQYDALLIDLQHMMYSYLYDKAKNPKNYINYINNPTYNRYFSVIEWDYIFYKYEFKYKYGNVLWSSMTYNPPYDNQMYVFYQNIK